MRRTRLEASVSELFEAIKPYDAVDIEMRRLVDGWQQLTPDIRRVVGNLAPELIDAVISIEDRRRELIVHA